MLKAIQVLVVFFLFAHSFLLKGQISDGGYPIEVVSLKSSKKLVVEMPKVNNYGLLKASVDEYSDEKKLKPFRFAHSFNVNINQENSGELFEDVDGYNVWQVRIKSEGALSLNLIFSPFKIPPGSKLYILNADETKKLGAFTDFNNKSFNSFAVSPMAGDEIIVQYEEPINADFEGKVGISKVNHDFYGVVGLRNDRRPLGKSGSCNIDINCELAEEWKTLKNSVCRIFIGGTELCTGTLINNTAQDETPYVLTAFHCFKDHVNGEQNSIFLFNYQSPYCGNIDGDNSNSISGSILKADFDSLDFKFLELSNVPPPEYRPYYAGWDNSGNVPTYTATIHHPVGDTKKIAIDWENPVIDSFGSKYTPDGFWNVLEWDYGTTELGSSGSGFFNQDHKLIGTLTGGSASCSYSRNDYFSRFDLHWDYREASNKQLKHWLDPLGTNQNTLEGLVPYSGIDLCDAFTNMQDGDTHQLVGMLDENSKQVGYWGGSNSFGVTEFVEKFSIPGDENLQGISLGVGLLNQDVIGGYITLKVYNGSSEPEDLVYTLDVSISEMVEGAMNFIGFDRDVEPGETFFIGFDVSNLLENDEFAVYQSYRENGADNSLFIKQDDVWAPFTEKNENGIATSLTVELIACNVLSDSSNVPTIEFPIELNVFPNPSSSNFKFTISEPIFEKDIYVYDMLGRQARVVIKRLASKRFEIQMEGSRSGVYFLRIQNEDFTVTRKISYLAY